MTQRIILLFQFVIDTSISIILFIMSFRLCHHRCRVRGRESSHRSLAGIQLAILSHIFFFISAVGSATIIFPSILNIAVSTTFCYWSSVLTFLGFFIGKQAMYCIFIWRLHYVFGTTLVSCSRTRLWIVALIIFTMTFASSALFALIIGPQYTSAFSPTLGTSVCQFQAHFTINVLIGAGIFGLFDAALSFGTLFAFTRRLQWLTMRVDFIPASFRSPKSDAIATSPLEDELYRDDLTLDRREDESVSKKDDARTRRAQKNSKENGIVSGITRIAQITSSEKKPTMRAVISRSWSSLPNLYDQQSGISSTATTSPTNSPPTYPRQISSPLTTATPTPAASNRLTLPAHSPSNPAPLQLDGRGRRDSGTSVDSAPTTPRAGTPSITPHITFGASREAVGNTSVGNEDSSQPRALESAASSSETELHLLAYKYAFLVLVAVCSTIILQTLSTLTQLFFISTIDSVVNALCVFLSFSFTSKYYKKVCLPIAVKCHNCFICCDLLAEYLCCFCCCGDPVLAEVAGSRKPLCWLLLQKIQSKKDEENMKKTQNENDVVVEDDVELAVEVGKMRQK